MKIDVLCNDGSPIGVTPLDVPRRGVGGAELAMLTLVEVLALRGHEVSVYNDPEPGEVEVAGVRFRDRRSWRRSDGRDAIIIFRSPALWADWKGSARIHIWWSTDQYTVGDFRAMAAEADVTVCISPYHLHYHVANYGLDPRRAVAIDLGVRTWEYEAQRPKVAKVAKRLIYCSMPDRGLNVLAALWPALCVAVPGISLTITGDYRLWGAPRPGDTMHRLAWAEAPNVRYLGAIPRAELVREQLEAEILAYPCIYEELFCVAAAECAAAGALPVTSGFGALPTTNTEGIIIPGVPGTPDWNAEFVARIQRLLTAERPYLASRQAAASRKAMRRFDWVRIARQWERVLAGECPLEDMESRDDNRP